MHRYLALFCVARLATPQNQPTFQAGTRLVEVDVVVRNKSGPVIGLTKGDFTLFDEGKPQKISVFSVRAARSSKEPPVGRPPGTVSNRLNPEGADAANATVVLFDQKNTPPAYQAFAIQRIVKFVQMRRKRDRIGIYTFGRDHVLRAVQELTEDAELLNRAASSLKVLTPSYRVLDLSGAPAGAADVMVLEFQEREADTKHVLQAIARHLANVPGRKTLIWVTTGFPLVVETRKVYIDFRPDMEAAAHSLNEANVALYAVDARGLMGPLSGIAGVTAAESAGPRSPAQLLQQSRAGGKNPDPQDRRTMAMLADRTGGLLFYDNSNGLEDSMQNSDG